MCLTDIAIWENGKKVLTMNEYVNRETAIRALLNDAPEQVGYSREDAADCIRYMDAADVAPVRHARWEVVVGSDGKEHMVCTGCRKQQDLTGVFSYCPNCGAKMDGKST